MTTDTRPISTDTRPKFTYNEFQYFPEDGMRHEIIDGEHYVDAAPSTYHQTVSKRLQYFLYTQVELAHIGTVFDAPIAVQLSETDVVQPDLIVLLNRPHSLILPTRVRGNPDLVVEILSPSTLDYDQSTKRRLYERAGIPEVWIVDPFGAKVTKLVLVNGTFEEFAVGDELSAENIPAIRIRLSDVW